MHNLVIQIFATMESIFCHVNLFSFPFHIPYMKGCYKLLPAPHVVNTNMHIHARFHVNLTATVYIHMYIHTCLPTSVIGIVKPLYCSIIHSIADECKHWWQAMYIHDVRNISENV